MYLYLLSNKLLPFLSFPMMHGVNAIQTADAKRGKTNALNWQFKYNKNDSRFVSIMQSSNLRLKQDLKGFRNLIKNGSI